MHKISIRKIGNVGKFIDMVKESKGKVYLELPNQELCDLKESNVALQMLYMINPREFWLDLFLTDLQDGYRFMEFMLGAS
ncbi:MAG: hypothetical protein NC416_08285 [Eubacterium sp.]|nr:hypothetical protein [Eubacterium sp.]